MSIKITLELKETDMQDQITVQVLQKIVYDTKADLKTCWHEDDIKSRNKVSKAAKYLLKNWLLDQSEADKFERDLKALREWRADDVSRITVP
jgi:DNA-directed RNA polymerase subunit F